MKVNLVDSSYIQKLIPIDGIYRRKILSTIFYTAVRSKLITTTIILPQSSFDDIDDGFLLNIIYDIIDELNRPVRLKLCITDLPSTTRATKLWFSFVGIILELTTDDNLLWLCQEYRNSGGYTELHKQLLICASRSISYQAETNLFNPFIETVLSSNNLIMFLMVMFLHKDLVRTRIENEIYKEIPDKSIKREFIKLEHLVLASS